MPEMAGLGRFLPNRPLQNNHCCPYPGLIDLYSSHDFIQAVIALSAAAAEVGAARIAWVFQLGFHRNDVKNCNWASLISCKKKVQESKRPEPQISAFDKRFGRGKGKTKTLHRTVEGWMCEESTDKHPSPAGDIFAY